MKMPANVWAVVAVLAIPLALLIMAVGYFRKRTKKTSTVRPETWAGWQPSLTGALATPEGYCFHPCHTWAVREGVANVRVGLDAFATSLFGAIERIEVVGLNRWVRQGQRLMTVIGAGMAVDLFSPVDGELKELNRAVLKDPALVVAEPYGKGWIAVIRAPEIAVCQRNLLRGPMADQWMRNDVARVSGMVSQLSPVVAEDGTLPLRGLLAKVPPELQNKLVQEFFLASTVARVETVAL
jgi:glycine cleavage system H protein